MKKSKSSRKETKEFKKLWDAAWKKMKKEWDKDWKKAEREFLFGKHKST